MERVAFVEFTEPIAKTNPCGRAARTSTSTFVFVTYAIEIEGEAPMLICAEAVDD